MGDIAPERGNQTLAAHCGPHQTRHGGRKGQRVAIAQRGLVQVVHRPAIEEDGGNGLFDKFCSYVEVMTEEISHVGCFVKSYDYAALQKGGERRQAVVAKVQFQRSYCRFLYMALLTSFALHIVLFRNNQPPPKPRTLSEALCGAAPENLKEMANYRVARHFPQAGGAGTACRHGISLSGLLLPVKDLVQFLILHLKDYVVRGQGHGLEEPRQTVVLFGEPGPRIEISFDRQDLLA
jgi:hypothetical protein